MIIFKGKSAEEINIDDVREIAEGHDFIAGRGDMNDINHVVGVAKLAFRKNISDEEKLEEVRKAMR